MLIQMHLVKMLPLFAVWIRLAFFGLKNALGMHATNDYQIVRCIFFYARRLERIIVILLFGRPIRNEAHEFSVHVQCVACCCSFQLPNQWQLN